MYHSHSFVFGTVFFTAQRWLFSWHLDFWTFSTHTYQVSTFHPPAWPDEREALQERPQLLSWNHRIVSFGRDFKDHLFSGVTLTWNEYSGCTLFARTCFLTTSSNLAGVLLSLQQGVLNFIANLYLLYTLSCWQAEMASKNHKHCGWCGSWGCRDTCIYPSPRECRHDYGKVLWSFWARWCFGAEPALPRCTQSRPLVVCALSFFCSQE